MAFRTGEQSQEWLCNVAAGVEITLNVRDSAGTIAYSSPVEVRKSALVLLLPPLYVYIHRRGADGEAENSTDLTCLPGYVPPPS